MAGIALQYLGEHLAVERRVDVLRHAVRAHNRRVCARTGHHYNPAAVRVSNAAASLMVIAMNKMSRKLKLPPPKSRARAAASLVLGVVADTALRVLRRRGQRRLY